PRSRLKTYQRIFCPASARMVGVLPTNDRPLRQNDGMLLPPASTTLCWLGPLLVQRTCPPAPTVTALVPPSPMNWLSTRVTAASGGPPATTLITPLIERP